MAVVDAECRVHGIDALRVVDSSIMPTVTNGNINAPTIMIGEKAADHILNRTMLKPSAADVYVPHGWENHQREGQPHIEPMEPTEQERP